MAKKAQHDSGVHQDLMHKGCGMIELANVTVTYHGASTPTLQNVNLMIDEGELCLVVGSTGTGKSTLLGTMHGLVPHFTGGTLAGKVMVGGRATERYPPRELADVVGVVGQDPLAGFVTDVVEEELAYAMEQLAVAPSVMRTRVEETLDLLGLAELRSRRLAELSGGQQQRVAIASVLAAGPQILILDEPTSALDPTAAEEVLAAINRLVDDLGITVVVAEHRLERVAQHADTVIWVPGDGSVVAGDPTDVLTQASVAPPVVELGEIAGFSPIPRSVRDARRQAPALRERLEAVGAPVRAGGAESGDSGDRMRARDIVVTYGPIPAVRGVNLDVGYGDVVALMGRNGSGKSSLLWAIQGSGPRQRGTVDVDGADPGRVSRAVARRLVGMVPQTPADLLYLPTVDAELAAADKDADAESGSARALLDRLADSVAGHMNPRDLSEGQRLALVLAVQLVQAPRALLLDEPTRGLDYDAKRQFVAAIRELSADGHALVVATHDVELVAAMADRVAIMAEGEIVVEGPAAEVLTGSRAFAPQISKVLGQWLTVDEVAAALDVPLRRRRPVPGTDPIPHVATQPDATPSNDANSRPDVDRTG